MTKTSFIHDAPFKPELNKGSKVKKESAYAYDAEVV